MLFFTCLGIIGAFIVIWYTVLLLLVMASAWVAPQFLTMDSVGLLIAAAVAWTVSMVVGCGFTLGAYLL